VSTTPALGDQKRHTGFPLERARRPLTLRATPAMAANATKRLWDIF
jgi:hypothetical protein